MKQKIETEIELTASHCRIHDKFDPRAQSPLKEKSEPREITCATGAFLIDFYGRLNSIIFSTSCRILELKHGNILFALNEYDGNYADWATFVQPLPGKGIVALHSDSSKIGEFLLRPKLLLSILIEHFQMTIEKPLIANITYTRDFAKEEEECKAIQQ
jgi:hypothetical protein